MASICLTKMESGDEINEKFVVQVLYHCNTGRCVYNTNNKQFLPNYLNLESEKQT